MKALKKIKFSEIIDLLKKNQVDVNSNIPIDEYFTNIKTLTNSSSYDLSFFSNEKYLKDLQKTKAKACLINKKFSHFLPESCQPIYVEDPYLSLAIISMLFFKNDFKSNGIISNNTSINKYSNIYNNVQIEPFTNILGNTKIYDNVFIGSNSNIGPNAIINKNVVIHDNVSISNAIIYENCEIKSGVRIGGTGFGFEEKSKTQIYHNGNVVIGKNSFIGSNTTIDRAVFDSTKIGEYSNIDNLVQIAHNVTIGNFAIIAAQVGIAGSTDIGNYVKIGGQAGIAGHLSIGNNVTIAGKSGVTKNISNNEIVAGFPAKDIKLWKKEVIRNSLKK